MHGPLEINVLVGIHDRAETFGIRSNKFKTALKHGWINTAQRKEQNLGGLYVNPSEVLFNL